MQMFLMSRTFVGIAATLIIIGGVLLPKMAEADEYDYFFEITCKPELGYFSLHTIQINESFCNAGSTPNAYCSEADKAERPDGHLQDPRALVAKPYSCQLGDRKLTVHATDRTVPWKEGLGGCPTRENYDLEIKMDGVSIHSFHAYGQGPGQCDTPETHLVELFEDQLRDCVIPEFSSSAPACETQTQISEMLKGDDQKSKKASR